MPTLFIRTRNSEFHSRDEGAEYDRPQSALALGIQGAVAMAADEIARGRQSSAIEVSVELDGGRELLRSVVAILVSPLITGEQTVVSDITDG